MCKRLPHLLALIHVSTAYANCNRKCVLEAVYPPPPNYDNWLDVLQWVDENDLDKLTSDILGIFALVGSGPEGDDVLFVYTSIF